MDQRSSRKSNQVVVAGQEEEVVLEDYNNNEYDQEEDEAAAAAVVVINERCINRKPATMMKMMKQQQQHDQVVVVDEERDQCRFVKVNMDGFPVGRKIDIKACDSYASLSHALQQLCGTFFNVDIKTAQEIKAGGFGEVTSSGRHVLLYEDHEGDRMLVGDVSWEMFVNSVKRLRIMKASQVQTIASSRLKKDNSC